MMMRLMVKEGGSETTLELLGLAGWIFLRKRKKIVGCQNAKDVEGEECCQSCPMKTPTILLLRTYSVLEGPAVARRSPYLRPFCRGIPPPRRKLTLISELCNSDPLSGGI